MKRNRLMIGLMAGGLTFAALTQSCVSESPFGNGEGEGTLRMRLVVNSDLTRAEIQDDELSSSCVVYVSGEKGLLYKYEGIDNVPEELKLKTGSYVAEAWTGDSVPASFTSRFFRGYAPFSIQDGANTSVVLTCKIANVVVSVNDADIPEGLMNDWSLTVSNSRGSLVFDKNNSATDKGFFMMPNCDIATDGNGNYLKDEDGWTYFTNLKYTIEGTKAGGEHFEKSGYVANPNLDGNLVQRAHEYRLNLEYSPEYEAAGGGFITVVIDEKEVDVKEEIGIYSRPSIKGATFEIDHQLVGQEGEFGENIIKVTGFKALTNIRLSSDDYKSFGIDAGGIDLMLATDEVKDNLRALGLDWDYKYNEERNLTTSYIKLSPDYLNNLEQRDEEYRLNVYVKDGYGKENNATVRIAVGEGAIVAEDPIIFDPIDENLSPMAFTGTKATIQGVVDEEAVSPKLMYRKAGSNDPWQTVDINLTRATRQFVIELTGLQPATRYEYRAAAEGWEGSTLNYFSTETPFEIPFADMETWSMYKDKVWFVGSNYDNNFWDSGNHGSTTIGVNITQKVSSPVHGGSGAAELKTQFVGVSILGKLAAGNLFIGRFGATNGTKGASLTFGQPYNGTHPESLNVWVSYQPVKITDTDNRVSLTKNDMDQGQIYVAFASKAQDIDTSNGIYFNPDDPSILAYGEKTWANGETAGSSSGLELVNIPIVWRESAKTQKATHIIIVCSASKYGDYFVGGRGSVMYLDDFELVY